MFGLNALCKGIVSAEAWHGVVSRAFRSHYDCPGAKLCGSLALRGIDWYQWTNVRSEYQNAGECSNKSLTGRCCMGSQMSEAPCLLGAYNFCSLEKNIRPCLLDTYQPRFEHHSGLLQELR